MPKPNIILGPIVGGLSLNSANIWVRADAPSTLHVWLATKPNLKDTKHVGETELFSNEGFAGIVSLTRLKSETEYFYAVSLQNSQPEKANFHTFTTFPKENTRRSFSFMFGSCYLPNGEEGSLTFDKIHEQIDVGNLRFGIFLGDQIYADIAERNGINKIAVTLDEYRSVYVHAWSRPSIKKLLPDLPLFMTLDDHEVDDDWRWDDSDRVESSLHLYNRVTRFFKGVPAEQRKLPVDRVRAALKAYQEHQAMHAPKMLTPLQVDSEGQFMFQRNDEGTFAYTFTHGAATFFVLDTRTHRSRKGKNKLLGEAQWKMLEDWLLEVKDKYPVKFLVSSGSVLYPFLLDPSQDRWSGFRSDRERLFQILAENEIEGIHILTGDLHSAHAVSAEIKCPSGRRIPIWEFCSTPFEQSSMWISATYVPILFSKWIRKQKKHFYQTGNNFGVVHVDFDTPTPQVSFTLHYNEDGWKSLPPIKT